MARRSSLAYIIPRTLASLFNTHLFIALSDPPPIHPRVVTYDESGIHCVIDVQQFSSLDRLRRVISYVLRFIGQFRKRTSFRQAQLTVQETILAETLWTQSCEQSTYQSESDNLTSKNKPRITLVKPLRLFLDDQLLIRCEAGFTTLQ